jgi:hypothetical protein
MAALGNSSPWWVERSSEGAWEALSNVTADEGTVVISVRDVGVELRELRAIGTELNRGAFSTLRWTGQQHSWPRLLQHAVIGILGFNRDSSGGVGGRPDGH